MRILLRLMLLSVLLISEAHGEVLKLAAWNLSWLTLRPQGAPELPADVVPKRTEDIARLRDYALKLDADVVAFSEVDGPEIAAQVFPPSHYAIHITGDHVVQRVGFAVRRGLGFIAHPDLTALDVQHLEDGTVHVERQSGEARVEIDIFSSHGKRGLHAKIFQRIQQDRGRLGRRAVFKHKGHLPV
jgi:hypothetical protein